MKKCPLCNKEMEGKKKEICIICAFSIWKQVNGIIETGFGFENIKKVVGIKNRKSKK